MANTVTGKLVRDVRLDAEGKIASGGTLRLRGEMVPVHRDCAAELLAPPAQKKRVKPVQQNKQAIPPATKEL